ncbi:hypothetical protein [Anaerovorax sp. IOR16]|uniref:hypothetical protein n=1 Tax=Anaerovorax sp. IOR16 TaxID=2773458 RepID=UPI0019D1B267|nr:hypothetical protein [Anaerovorax sp. IOR16]MEA4987384.1 hypothetical protein [Anaerovorax sp.]
MPNAMKLIVRTLLIVFLMVFGTWLSKQLAIYANASGNLRFVSSIAMYMVYLVIGIAAGSMVSMRFTKNKYVYLFPIFIFLVIAIAPLLYLLLPLLPFPWIANYLSQFTYLSWTLTGVFLALAFR